MDKMQQQLDRIEAMQEGVTLMLSVIVTMLTKRPEDRAFIKQAIENLVLSYEESGLSAKIGCRRRAANSPAAGRDGSQSGRP